MLFTPFQGKPVTRMAFQITAAHKIEKVAEATYHATQSNERTIISIVSFKAYEEPKVGDWVVRLTEDDTYHCTDAVFRERNIVSDTYGLGSSESCTQTS
jgi:hypothetical protein